jgi:magnesium chelatase family protein
MTVREILETTRIHSVAGLLSPELPVVMERPFRRPHHTVSYAGLVGGGSVPRPGEMSLAHHGVLFLDELAEFPRQVLETLRQPMEEGSVTLSRARIVLTYPARFMLVAAMNPCPCGNLTHPERPCRCTESEVRRYQGRVSGPLLDRIDLHVEVPPVPVGELAASISDGAGSPPARRSESVVARERVERARSRQLERYAGLGIYCNAQLGPRSARRALSAEAAALALLERAAATGGPAVPVAGRDADVGVLILVCEVGRLRSFPLADGPNTSTRPELYDLSGPSLYGTCLCFGLSVVLSSTS